MRHHLYNSHFNSFLVSPQEFNKYTPRNLLQYALGATLYMPASKDFYQGIVSRKFLGLTSMVMCFEDSIDESEVPAAEVNVISMLEKLSSQIESGDISQNDIPLIFFRVRNFEQFKSFSANLVSKYAKVITGFVFPKFSAEEGILYLHHLKQLNVQLGEIIYGMPILESKKIVYKETRTNELIEIGNILRKFNDLILNVRVGATDFSSSFGVRRGIDYSIYDIMTVRGCLSDILNLFGREEEDFVISAPVWEYFSVNKNIDFSRVLKSDFQSILYRGSPIVDKAIDGLLREVIIDKANGFIGKTVIHPTHINYVNAMQAVIREEFEDAKQILNTSGGVVKSSKANKMNEINPHTYWAKKILQRAQIYGVVENESSIIELFS